MLQTEIGGATEMSGRGRGGGGPAALRPSTVTHILLYFSIPPGRTSERRSAAVSRSVQRQSRADGARSPDGQIIDP